MQEQLTAHSPPTVHPHAATLHYLVPVHVWAPPPRPLKSCRHRSSAATMAAASGSVVMRRPDDLHLHLRDGEYLKTLGRGACVGAA